MPALSERILNALLSDAVVVTSTSRLAQEVRRDYAQYQSQKSVQAWKRGNVMSWDAWLRSLGELVLWSGYSSPSGRRRLLSPIQERVLWEKIVEEEPGSAPLNIPGTARLASRAWQMLQQWRMPDPGSAGRSSAEQVAFSRWMERYHSLCSDNSWLDSARVIDSLIPAISSGAVAVPAQVLLAGFDGFTPQQRGLLRALTSMGTQMTMAKRQSRAGNAGLLSLPNADAELQTAVRWLRGLVVGDRTARAGLVVPDLEDSFLKIERALDNAMLPAASLPGAISESGRPYEIGAGRPLRKQPVVVAADHVLALSMGTVSMRVLSRIIQSPFIAGGITEAARRARFDAWIRDKGSVDIDVQHLPGMLEAFRHFTGISREEFALEGLVSDLVENQEGKDSRLPGAWAIDFASRLKLFGWPGEGKQDAIQQQAQQEFERLLTEFGSLDQVLGELAAPEALRVLRQLLRSRHFEFQTPNVPISVLQPADAEWLSFDHLWICNAASGKWSQIIDRPNPFIPLEWQRDLKLPQSAPASRARRADQLTTRLLSAADQVVVSKIDNSAQGFMLKSFSAIPEISLQQIELADLTDYRRALAASTGIETISDESGPVLDPVETIDLNQDALALQSACPFRAFATERLGAAPLRALRPGVRPEARVLLVKMALEHLWHRIESSEVLQAALSGDHLEVQTWEVADTVLAVFERKLPVRLSKRYRALEHARLVRLLLQWLPVESGREAFLVNRTDASVNMDIGGVSLRAHVDRVDQVTGVGSVIINYALEPFSAERLTGDRPDAPTLLLYTLAAEDKPVAILTGCVADDRMELSGVQHKKILARLPLYEESELFNLTGLSWDRFLEQSRTVLEKLSNEFAAGDARVAPKYGNETCSSCHLSTLCRINENATA